ncbi:hypothetical protein GSY74_10585 [Sulfurovum sp. bin170]|uniref:hypothetical protein n=1 Tax=Sulfurovum sp. bin170 TaxID=2695268 RepID=UPI0013DFABD7|nr:hypothetical protein [Sulfurovum sp. bin170]NEW61733.1 hypothetical protein [Sulfurovum sp. bin170]
MRYLITLSFLTISLFGFDYHLKPYTMTKNVVCFFGLGTEAHENNGGNIANSCYIELKDGYVVVDSGPTYSYAQQAYTIMQNRKNLPVKYIINTSIDESQILGNGFYKEQGAILLGPKGYDENIELTLDKKITPDAFVNTRVVPLDREITKDTKIKCCTMRIDIDKIIEDDDNYLTVYIPDRKLILAGDMIFNNRLPSLNNGRSLLKWIEALKKIENSSWDTIISAHGVKTKRSSLKNTKSYLTMLRDEVRESIKNGSSREDAIENIKMLSFQEDKLYDIWHKKNISLAYDELKNEEKSNPTIALVPPMESKKVDKPKVVQEKEKPKKPEIEKPKEVKKKREPSIQYDNFDTAMRLAKKYKKIVLLKIRSDNCPYCDELDIVMKRSSKIKRMVNANYRMTYLNNSRDKLPLGIEVGLTPALVFIRPDTKEIVMTIKGIRAIGELIDVLKEGIKDGRANGYLK